MNLWMAEVARTWRGSVRRPGFLVIAAGVLALGIAASASVFTLIDGVLLKPLPYADASRLVLAGPMENGLARHGTGQQYRQLEGIPGLASRGLMLQLPILSNVAGNGLPEAVTTVRIDRGVLPTLGVSPLLGRNFNAQEDTPHGPAVVILAHGFWMRRFAGAPVVGKTLTVEGVAHTIVGVLPARFAFPGQVGDIVLPLALPPTGADGSNYLAIGRLVPGSSVDTVSAQVDMRLRAFFAARGDRFWLRRHFGVSDLTTFLHQDSRPVLTLFLASAVLLLLIAMVNLTNLMLLRLLSRTHDLAVRSALGAPRFRIALPVLAEGLLVGIVGSVFGVALAVVTMGLVQGMVPVEWLAGGNLHLGMPTGASALLLGIAIAVAASALGIRRGLGGPDIDSLREGGRLGAGRESGRLGRVLVVVQVALATVLLSAAGLFLHALYDLGKVPMGFRTASLLTLEFAPVLATYPDAAAVQSLLQRLEERMRLVPGVVKATATTNLPAGDVLGQWNTSMRTSRSEEFGEQYRGISPGFFSVFGVPLLEGRDITEGDRRGGVAVGVVTRAFADKYLGGHALGELVTGLGWSVRIVGVVGDTRQMGPQDVPNAILYVPMAQVPDDMFAAFRSFEPVRMALQVNGDPDGYRNAIRKAFAEVAPDQPIANMRSMAWIVRETTADVRSNLVIIGMFAVLALVLAAAGLYAVMAVAVAAREREFGVRLALGAPRHRLIGLLLRGGLLQVGVGLLCGAVLALACNGVARAVLVDVGRSALDPVVLAAVCALLALVGLLACLPPAWRASRTPPMHALRGE